MVKLIRVKSSQRQGEPGVKLSVKKEKSGKGHLDEQSTATIVVVGTHGCVVVVAARATRLACVGLPAVVAVSGHRAARRRGWCMSWRCLGHSTKDGGARTAGWDGMLWKLRDNGQTTRTPKCRHVVAKVLVDHPPYTDQHAPAGTRSQDIVDAVPTNKPKKLSTSITTPEPAPHVPSATPRRSTSTHNHHRWESNASQPSSACRGDDDDDDDAAARPNHNGCGSGGGVLYSPKCPCRAPTTTVAEGWSTVRQHKFHGALL
ncbi:hypothetical protein EDB84DRAFT_1436534 [Lactarius hengduanensis]|nr:hypothetical protein EDB84DRAFT_1436534 [Lactarius hengduanensis]